MIRDLQHYLRLPYTTRVAADEGTLGERVFLASVEELPGCESHGSTPEEALASLRDAMELYLASMLDDGLEPPEPGVESAGWSKGGRASAA
jgi:predicted RNase H-like HicB family nuclease